MYQVRIAIVQLNQGKIKVIRQSHYTPFHLLENQVHQRRCKVTHIVEVPDSVGVETIPISPPDIPEGGETTGPPRLGNAPLSVQLEGNVPGGVLHFNHRRTAVGGLV